MRVRIDLAGSDGLEEMKIDKIEPQKNFHNEITLAGSQGDSPSYLTVICSVLFRLRSTGS